MNETLIFRDLRNMKQLAFAVVFSLAFVGQTLGKQPNVILILTDDQGSGDVSPVSITTMTKGRLTA
jgi:hypothetical protein